MCSMGTDLNSASQVWFRPTSCAYDLAVTSVRGRMPHVNWLAHVANLETTCVCTQEWTINRNVFMNGHFSRVDDDIDSGATG